MPDPLISVIIPVYNTERYLSACLDSVLSQSYRNIEVIIINDGSTDFSLKIAETYQEKDDRIRVYSYENGGLSVARNHGLAVATGDYITFVDSDDLLLPGALEIMKKFIYKNQADIVEGVMIHGKIPRDIIIPQKFSFKIYDSEKAIEDVLYQKRLLPSVCGKLYKKFLFDSIKFENNLLYEDLNIFYLLIDNATKIIWADYPVYFYRDTENSIINLWQAKRLDVLRVTEEIEKYITEKHPKILSAAKDRRLSANFNMYALCSIHGEKEQAKQCWEYIKSNRKQSLYNPNVRIKNKAGILLSYLGKNAFNLVSRRIYK